MVLVGGAALGTLMYHNHHRIESDKNKLRKEAIAVATSDRLALNRCLGIIRQVAIERARLGFLAEEYKTTTNTKDSMAHLARLLSADGALYDAQYSRKQKHIAKRYEAHQKRIEKLQEERSQLENKRLKLRAHGRNPQSGYRAGCAFLDITCFWLR